MPLRPVVFFSAHRPERASSKTKYGASFSPETRLLLRPNATDQLESREVGHSQLGSDKRCHLKEGKEILVQRHIHTSRKGKQPCSHADCAIRFDVPVSGQCTIASASRIWCVV